MGAASPPGRRGFRPFLAAPLAAALVAAVGCGGGDSDAAGDARGGADSPTQAKVGTGTIDIAEFKYKPETVTVRAGGAVRFENADGAPHTATSDPGAPAAFDTGDLDKGDSKRVVVRRPGTYAYHCDFHPFMKGTLRVTR